jgi:nucleotide-binding universal stress UspA family protein
MLTIRKILVPVNFTDACRGAAQFAMSLAGNWNARVHILHVLESSLAVLQYESGLTYEHTVEAQRKHACAELQQFLKAAPSEQLTRVLLEGDPATEIVRMAHNEKFDLILMPTRGRGSFRRFLLGSVTAKVLHDSECPVWTGVHPEVTDTEGLVSIRRIGCAVDLGPQSKSTLTWASGFAQHCKAHLSIIHVLEALPDDTWRERVEAMAREQISALQAEQGLDADVLIGYGKGPATVAGITKTASTDLLVIGRGHGGSAGRLGGSAYSIVRDAHCPVVSV